MTVLETDTDRGDAVGSILRNVVDLVEAQALLRERTGDLVDEHGARETTATNDLALRAGDGDVITDGDELDLVRLVGAERGVLLLRETEVEDVTGVVP